MTETRASDV